MSSPSSPSPSFASHLAAEDSFVRAAAGYLAEEGDSARCEAGLFLDFLRQWPRATVQALDAAFGHDEDARQTAHTALLLLTAGVQAHRADGRLLAHLAGAERPLQDIITVNTAALNSGSLDGSTARQEYEHERRRAEIALDLLRRWAALEVEQQAMRAARATLTPDVAPGERLAHLLAAAVAQGSPVHYHLGLEPTDPADMLRDTPVAALPLRIALLQEIAQEADRRGAVPVSPAIEAARPTRAR